MNAYILMKSERIFHCLHSLIFLSLLLMMACSETSSPANPDQGVDLRIEWDAPNPDTWRPDLPIPDAAMKDSTPSPDGALPTLAQLTSGWNIMYTGGSTICSRGTKYGFGVYKGSVNRIVVDFEGGGACWTHTSCSVSGALFKENVEDSFKLARQGYSLGIYDKQNTANPFKDWYHVFIPYCTGDIHWGNQLTTYKDSSGGNSFQIHHKGAINVKEVLKWIYANFSAPEKIFVTGCSAGSYGSLMWSSYLAKQYPSTKIYQFGDSGAGIITQTFMKDSFPQWNALQASPTWIPALDITKVDLMSKDMSYLYVSAANYHSNQLFSQYNTLFDETQVFYYQAMGGSSSADWSKKMVASVDTIIKQAPTFRAFMLDGKKHCILPYKELYTYSVNGVKLVDWLTDMVNDKPIQTQRCATCVPAP